MPYLIYIASTLAAISLYMMMPRRGFQPGKFGALLGAATLGGLWLLLAEYLPEPTDRGVGQAVMVYYYIFSAVAIISAARVITHDRPVYAALWFVMVVLSSAGLILILGAEFIGFASVIIYGGAILVTYLFVIMLASQSGDSDGRPDHDRIPREPAAAVIIGFVLLSAILTAAFPTAEANLFHPNRFSAAPTDADLIAEVLTSRPVQNLSGENGALAEALAGESEQLSNAERIGLDLFQGHPLGIELAGIILLVCLVGAVVIAKTRVDSFDPKAGTDQ